MQNHSRTTIIQRFTHWSIDHSNQISKTHQQILAFRRAGLRQISNEISIHLGGKLTLPNHTPALFDIVWLKEFATGDIVKTLGKEFEIYKNRRSPRIPNGDLLLMSRILSIQGKRGEFNIPSSIIAEFDVPENSWFFDGATNDEVPFSILLEIALQPCGTLSAWIGTQLRFPEIDFFFRNLDGDVNLLEKVDFRGKTIQTKASLTKTVFSGTTIIQHFGFELFCDGTPIFRGTSSFGYFPVETMASQTGLDGGSPSQPWGKTSEGAAGISHIDKTELSKYPDFPRGKMCLISNIDVSSEGKNQSVGYAMTTRQNSAEDWFYKNHFYQDPVMPGSLGIEAIIQMFKSAVHFITKSENPVSIAYGTNLKWKYRGQVLQKHKEMHAEVQITNQLSQNDSTLFTGNASLWADNIRIYEIQGITVQQQKGF